MLAEEVDVGVLDVEVGVALTVVVVLGFTVVEEGVVDDEEVEEGVTLAVDVELEGAVLAEDVEDGVVLAVDVEFDGLFAEAEVEEAPFIVASLFARLPVLVFDIDEDCPLFVL